MIGIGCTTTDETRYSIFLENLDANTTNYKFALAKDVKGIRKAKNQLLYELRECEYIFLFDDDCYPIKPGWVDFMIKAFESGQHHFQYNTEQIHGKMASINLNGVEVMTTYNGGGVFMAFTNKVLEVAGFMSPMYEGYGWEHLGYSFRIFRHGLTINPYVTPVGLDKYLHAEDYVRPQSKQLSDEERAQKDKNHTVFLSEACNLNPKRVIYGK